MHGLAETVSKERGGRGLGSWKMSGGVLSAWCHIYFHGNAWVVSVTASPGFLQLRLEEKHFS